MPETPHKAALKIDATIDQLNARWDLQIPRLHGLEARRAGDEAEAARKCSSRIRHFCWKANVSIDRIIEDFEERAAQKHSDWIGKCAHAIKLNRNVICGSRLRLIHRKTWAGERYSAQVFL